MDTIKGIKKAIKTNNFDVLRKILQIEQGKYLSTIILLTAYFGNYKVLKFLISNNYCDINYITDNNNTILHHAAAFARVGFITFILNNYKDCNIDIINSKGNTPFDCAAKLLYLNNSVIDSHDLFRVMGCLFEHGVDYKLDKLYRSSYYKKNRIRVDLDLKKSFIIRFARTSLLEMLVYYVKKNIHLFKNKIPSLVYDLRKLFE